MSNYDDILKMKIVQAERELAALKEETAEYVASLDQQTAADRAALDARTNEAAARRQRRESRGVFEDSIAHHRWVTEGIDPDAAPPTPQAAPPKAAAKPAGVIHRIVRKMLGDE